MLDDNDIKTENVIYTKYDEIWVFVDQYLDMLNYTSAVHDKEFGSMFYELTDYVKSKLALPDNGGKIIDMYHVVCQEKNGT